MDTICIRGNKELWKAFKATVKAKTNSETKKRLKVNEEINRMLLEYIQNQSKPN